MKEIPLTHGMVTLVDDEDYERLSKWKWHAQRSTHGGHVQYYAVRTDDKGRSRKLRMHREILGAHPGQQVDHRRPADTLDNRRENLRFATSRENKRNARKRLTPTSSRYKGVSWDAENGKWRACTTTNSKILNLGRFASEEEAARAYDRAAREQFGEFALLNFPEERPAA